MCQNKTDYNKAIEYLKTSPMFNLSLSSNELFHSNFLYWIWQVNKECFKKIINSLIGEENYWENNWEGKNLEVRREYKNFDLSIVEVLNSTKTKQDIDNKVDKSTSEPENESENGEYRTDGLILFVLENKIKSIPYRKQIEEYINKISTHNSAVVKKENSARRAKLRKLINDRKNQCRTENIGGRLKSGQSKEIEAEINGKNEALNTIISAPTSQLVLLSLVKDFPDKPKEHKWKIKSYEEYIEQIESLKFTDYNNLKTDYCQYVRNLITCIKEWDKFPEFNVGETKFLDYPFLPTAEELRLHALYSKYNYAKLCCILMQKTEEKFGEYKVQYIRKQDDIILLTGQDPKKKSQFNCYNDCFGDAGMLIGVGYDYSNMKPILEVKVVKKADDDNKLIYIIQVQGDKYEHGIIKKGTRSEVENFIDTNNELPKEWVNKIEGCNEIFGDNEVNDSYNGYNDTYSMVYKYRQITDKAKTKEVIEYIIKDVKILLKELDKQQ